jgi:hypothetical protein
MVHSLDVYLYSVHEVPVWAPVLGPLRSRGIDARFVLEPPGRNIARGSSPDPQRGWLDLKRERLVDLVDGPTEELIRRELATIGEQPLRRRRPGSAGATTQGSAWLRPYAGARIRLMYGVALVTDAYGHGPVNDGFDVVLAHGPFSAAAIVRAVPGAQVAVVGFPKWAAYRRGETSREEARQRLGLDDARRPVLAWLPTWAHNSSLDDSEALVALAGDFQVVMKPHHNSFKFEAARLEGIGAGVRVLPVTVSIVDVMVAADVIVSDVRSGGFTEGLLADRPVIGLAQPGPESRAALHPAAAEVADVCHDTRALPALALRAVDGDPHRDGRRRWVPELFGATGGADADLAADAIVAAISRRPSTRRRAIGAAAWSSAHRVSRLVRR